MILRLGSGRVAGAGCGPKAAFLDRAARAGLPVPPGVVVLDEAWRWAVDRGLVRVGAPGERRPVSVPDPSLLTHLLGVPAFGGPLAVRAAFCGADGTTASLPGRYVPGLFVHGQRAAAVAASLAGVWAGALGRPRGFRRDVILQAMIVARGAGMVYSERQYEDDLVDVTDGGTEPLISQRVRGWHVLLPKRRGRERPTTGEAIPARLQTLLRDVRRVFGEKDWEVEWADDGERVWLVQLRPLARATRRNDLFAAAVHDGRWFNPPSRLKGSLGAPCASALVDDLRRADSSFSDGRQLIEVVQERPFLNVSLLSDTLRRWGLPSRIVRDVVGGPPEREASVQWRRMLSHLPILLRLSRDHLRAVEGARRAAAHIRERTDSPPSRPSDVAGELLWLYRTVGSTTLSLTGAMIIPLSVLRHTGVLGEVTARWRSRRPELLEGVPLLREALGWREGLSGSPTTSLRGRCLQPVIRRAEQVLGARLHFLSVARDALERLEDALLEGSRTAAREGVLPSAEAIFELDFEEIRRLGDDLKPDTAFWSARAAETRSASGQPLPDVFRRLADLESHRP